MDQPQPCTKCKKLPEDILMLACSHDLCLDCASERLSFEMKKKKNANVRKERYRASPARFATKGRLLMPKALQNWRDSSLQTKHLLLDLMRNHEHHMIGLKEWFPNRR